MAPGLRCRFIGRQCPCALCAPAPCAARCTAVTLYIHVLMYVRTYGYPLIYKLCLAVGHLWLCISGFTTSSSRHHRRLGVGLAIQQSP